jgi:hypothetical protein
MTIRGGRSLLILFVVAAPAPAGAQRLDAARVGVSVSDAGFLNAPAAAPLHLVPAAQDLPPRWPFVLGGALIGGVAAGAWYAHEVSKNDDVMFDLSLPVVAIGIGAGAFTGFLVGEIVRAAVSPDTSRNASGTRH